MARPWTSKRAVLGAAGGLLTLLVVLAARAGYFELLEVKVHDWFCRRRPVSDTIFERLTVVEVQDHCIQTLGQWPWPRRTQAELVERVAALGAKVIGIDFLYVERSPDPADDRALEDAIRRAGNVYLACELKTQSEAVETVTTFESPFRFQMPQPGLEAAARGVGLVNVDFTHDNVDGILRKLPLAGRVKGRVVPSLSLALVSAYQDTTPQYLPDGGIAFPALGYTVPTYPTRFRSASAQEGLLAEPAYVRSAYLNFDPLTRDGNFNSVPASQLLTGSDPPDRSLFEGKIVLIGVTHSALDLKLTPYGQFPGIYMHANLIRNLLEHNFFRRLSPGAVSLVLVLTGVVATGMALSLSLLPALVLVLLSAVLWTSLAYWFFTSRLLLVDVVPVLTLGVAIVVLLELLEATLDLRRRMRNLTSLHELGRRFNAVLNLSELAETVMETYMGLTGATGAVLVSQTEGGESTELEQAGTVPDWLVVSLGKKGNQREILTTLAQRPQNVRLEDIGGLEVERFGREGVAFTPLVHHDGATGWLCLCGTDLAPALLDLEERDYWLALSSVVRNALENARLYKLATIDGLTNLYVRHFFDIAIEREFLRATRYGADLTLLITDVDHFKRFNDTYGHQMGDRVLRMVATEVKNCVRNVDIPARYGGEEFAIILPETPPAGARLIAERIRARIEELRIEHNGQVIRIAISVGVAVTKTSLAKNAAQFIKEADEALYQAKETGRNRVCLFGDPVGGPPAGEVAPAAGTDEEDAHA